MRSSSGALIQNGSGLTGTSSPLSSTPSPGWTVSPVSGTRKLLIVLVNFSNRTFVTTPQQWYDAVFSTATGAKSVANFYRDNSFGRLSIVPVSNTQPGSPAGVVTVNLSVPHEYNGTPEETWVAAAINQADQYVHFSTLDTDGDRLLERDEALVYFVAAGYEQSGSPKIPSLWAHASSYSSGGLAAAGISFPVWARSGELNNASVQHGIGVIAHELGHQLAGLPDLYDTAGVNAGLGAFSLMAAGSWGAASGENAGNTPVGLDAWSREFTGWSTPTVPSGSAVVSLGVPLAAPGNTLKLINSNLSSTEYFLAENRRPQGWDLGMTGLVGTGWTGGLLIEHVDNAMGTNESGATAHQGVVIEQAAKPCDMMASATCYGRQQTFFYSGNNGSFNTVSNPTSAFYAGPSNRNLDAISSPSGYMTISYSEASSGTKGTVTINGTAQYTNSLAVTLALSATTTAPATVQQMSFSNDGTTWSAWEPYAVTKAWTLAAGTDGTRTVSARFKDSALNVSSVVSDTITLDTTPPMATLSLLSIGTGSLTRYSSVVFTVSNTGVSSYRYKIDSGTWSSTVAARTSSTVSGLADGAHTLYAIAGDAAGNWQSATSPTAATFTVDTVPPTTTATPPGGTYTAAQSVTLAAPGSSAIYYTTSGSTPTIYSSRYGSPISVPVSMTLKYFAIDAAGNAETVKASSYTITPAPVAVISLTNATNGSATRNTSVSFTVKNASVSAYRYQLDGGAWSGSIAAGNVTTLSGLGNGTHTISAIAGNSAGTWQSTASPTKVQFMVDTVAPTTTATPPAGSYSAVQAVTLVASEKATIYYTTNGTTPTVYSNRYTGGIAVPASTTLKYFAVDAAGNSEAVKTSSYTITLPPPVAQITSSDTANGGVSRNTSATFTVKNTGVTTYRYKLDSGTWSGNTTAGIMRTVSGLANGTHTLSVIAGNAAGIWQSTASPTVMTWRVDTVAPTTTASPAGGSYATAQTVTFTSNESATIYYTTNGAAPTTASTRYSAPIAVSKSMNLRYFAVDTAGNTEAVKTSSYLIAGLPVTTNSYTFTVTGTGVVGYKYSLDGGAMSAEAPTSQKIVLTNISVGTHKLAVYGKNSSGVWSSYPSTVYFNAI